MTPYYEPEGGGLERYAHAILRRLAARGHDVDVLTFTRRASSEEIRDGVHVTRRTSPLRFGNTPVDPAFPRRVYDAMGADRPDVVLAHTPVPFPAEMAYLAARRRRVPFVATYHAGRLRGSSMGLDAIAAVSRATLEQRMLSGSSRIVAVGPYVRDHALARHRGRVSIVPPGVDLNRFRPNGPPSGRGVLFVGPLDRSYEWKGVDVLWDAFERVKEKRPDATLTLVGDGDRRAEFERRASHDPNVHVVGRLDEASLVKAYQDAHVVVLPSVTDAESFGMVLAEANACARPVVASRIGGIPDFVHDGDNGLLAEPGDAKDLALKIETVLGDAGLAREMGERGRARVEREHDWDDLATQTERVVELALGRQSRLTEASRDATRRGA